MRELTLPKNTMKQLANSWGKTKVLGNWNEKLGDFEPDIEYEIIINEEIDTGRWNSIHDLVFLDTSTGKYYHTRYEQGLTESQMYSPFDYDDYVECDEVTITQKPVTTIETTWKYK